MCLRTLYGAAKQRADSQRETPSSVLDLELEFMVQVRALILSG